PQDGSTDAGSVGYGRDAAIGSRCCQHRTSAVFGHNTRLIRHRSRSKRTMLLRCQDAANARLPQDGSADAGSVGYGRDAAIRSRFADLGQPNLALPVMGNRIETLTILHKESSAMNPQSTSVTSSSSLASAPASTHVPDRAGR